VGRLKLLSVERASYRTAFSDDPIHVCGVCCPKRVEKDRMENQKQQSVTGEDLLADLRSAGILSGDLLVVHSSLRSLGHVEGGAAAVVEALRMATAPGGAVFFPALSFRGSVTVFLRETKTVDLREMPSMNGAIPRAAGARPDALRSLHPTHSVIGVGDRAGEFLANLQSGQGPCGADSPFHTIALAGGKIGLIGVGNGCNTTLHCVEEFAAPYIFNGEVFEAHVIGMDGREADITVRGYTTDTPRDFAAIEPRLLAEGIMKIHPLAGAELRLLDGQRVVEEVTDWVRQEPYLLAKQD
jgi:aminoglycoside 3-N-acetyltransferase